MSDEKDWGETPLPATRKGPPRWMFACGCGCLVPGFLLVALVAWAMQFYGQATNPRLAYDSLAEILPYDEPLMGIATGLADDPSTRALESHENPEFDLLWGTEIPFSGGVAMFYLARGVRQDGEQVTFEDDALVAMFTRVDSDQSSQIMQLDEISAGEVLDSTKAVLEVQGLSLPVLRMPEVTSDILVEFPRGTMEITGPGAFVKVRSNIPRDPGDAKTDYFDVLLLLQRPVRSNEAIADEELRHFLAPFHVGPDR